MHEISNIENILNLIGIVLEIVGLIIVVSVILNWFRRVSETNLNWIESHYQKEKDSADNERGKKINKETLEDISNFKKFLSKNLERIIKTIGFFLILTGLVFQGLSTIFHR